MTVGDPKLAELSLQLQFWNCTEISAGTFWFKAEFIYSAFSSPLLGIAVRANLIAVLNELGSQQLVLKS